MTPIIVSKFTRRLNLKTLKFFTLNAW